MDKDKEVRVNRKQLLIMGIILVSVVVVFAVLLNLFSRSDDTKEDSNFATVSDLAYCNEEQVKPCVVSFGLDADNNMLVNFLLPDLSFPEFYLQIVRGEVNVFYTLQVVLCGSRDTQSIMINYISNVFFVCHHPSYFA